MRNMQLNSDKHWYIFRHGLATHSKNGYGDQILTAQVLPEGRPPIERLGVYMQAMPYEVGYRSEFLRCQQTAQIVSDATGNPFTPDARLNEMYQETFENVQERVSAFVADVNASPHTHIWVCTHGIVIAALRHYILDGEFHRAQENDYTQTGELLLIANGKDEVLNFREVV
jgi:broad specificity phosphatase PhoE